MTKYQDKIAVITIKISGVAVGFKTPLTVPSGIGAGLPLRVS